MRKFLVSAVAAAALATPAVARDGAPYVGIEGGLLKVENRDVDVFVDYTATGTVDVGPTQFGTVRYGTGYDIDLIAGYDFGMFRLEGELAHKRAGTKRFNVDALPLLISVNDRAGTDFVESDFDFDSSIKANTAMVNALIDIGGQDSIGGYLGGGFGRLWAKQFGESDSSWAYQGIAGLYMPIGANLDAGLKYRYLHSKSKLNFPSSASFAAGTDCGILTCTGGTLNFDTSDNYSSHSLLLSLVYNFAAPVVVAPPPPPPPPPAPVAPATQTCPDGSVILATDVCPAPPPPPPPPPPPVERGM